MFTPKPVDELVRDLEDYAEKKAPWRGPYEPSARIGLALPAWAIDRVEAIEDPKYRLDGWIVLHHFCRETTDDANALLFLRAAEATLPDITNPDWRDTRLKKCVPLWLDHGETGKAESSVREMGPGPKKVLALLALAEYWRNSGDASKDHAFLGEAQEVPGLCRKAEAAFDAWLDIGYSFQRQGDTEQARHAYLLAQPFLARMKTPDTRKQALSSCLSGVGESAMAMAMTEEITDPKILFWKFLTQAHSDQEAGRSREARGLLDKALALVRTLRGVKAKGALMGTLARTFLEWGDPPAALSLIEEIRDGTERAMTLLSCVQMLQEKSKDQSPFLELGRAAAENLPDGPDRERVLAFLHYLENKDVVDPAEEAAFESMVREMRNRSEGKAESF